MGNTAPQSAPVQASREHQHVIEYSPTNRAKCKRCKNNIGAGSVRVGRRVRSPFHDGFDTHYHHLRCSMHFLSDADSLQGWQCLKWPDVVKVMTKLGMPTPDESDPLVAKVKAINERTWTQHAELTGAKVPNKLLKAILEANGIVGVDRMKGHQLVLRCADGMANGLLPACPVCKTRALMAEGSIARCKGWFSGATRCNTVVPGPLDREPWVIPVSVTTHAYLGSWTPPDGAPAASPAPAPATAASDTATGKAKGKAKAKGKGKGKGATRRKRKRGEDDEEEAAAGAGAGAGAGAHIAAESGDEDVPEGQELASMHFAFIGKTATPRAELKTVIDDHGGTHANDIEVGVTTHLVTSQAEVGKKKKSARLKLAVSMDLPVVGEEFVLDCAKRENSGIKLRQRKHLKADGYLLAGGLGTALPSLSGGSAEAPAAAGTAELSPEEAERERAAKRARAAAARPVIKPGSAILKVDDEVECGSGVCNILMSDDKRTAYNAMLHITNLGEGINKFYQIQVVTKGKSFYFFKKWGRVGGSRGGWRNKSRTYRYNKADGAIADFEEHFYKFTGNEWEDRDFFVQKPGLYHMIELSTGNEADDDDAMDAGTDGKVEEDAPTLDPRVRDFVDTIFDVSMMKKQMEQQNIDLKKMPLGSLSKAQMEAGFGILREIGEILDDSSLNTSDRATNLRLVDASNRFYTVIPHHFSVRSTPPVINKKALLKEKLDLMQTLMDVAVASSVMKGARARKHITAADANYQALKCQLTPLDKSAAEFKMVETYLHNTHAKTHDAYTLEVLDVFSAVREGEDARFAPHADLSNRRLLWHGSRLSNWVGILSQGLRIAPPEAPVTGYMFGKGVYFADMCSKSANYCFTSSDSPTGVMLLCEVALGDMYERTTSEYRADLSCKKANCQSTWGIGRTSPDPAGTVTLDDGVVVPMGKGRVDKSVNSSLLYNEFIVYDTSQIKCRYVLKLKFNHKKSRFGW